MKGVEKVPDGFRRRNPKPQLLQPLIRSQHLEVIDTIPTGSKNRNERLHIVGLSILARSPKKGKMFLNGLRESQGSKGLHDQRNTAKRSKKEFRCILN